MKLSDLLAFIETPTDFDLLYRGNRVGYLNEDGAAFDDDAKFFIASNDAYGEDLVLIHVQAYRGDGFEPAYEQWIDSMPTVEADDLPDAYLVPGAESYQTFDDLARESMPDMPKSEYGNTLYTGPEADAWSAQKKALAAKLLKEAFDAAQATGNYPSEAEGYRMNSSGEIVDVGHYENIREADLDEVTIVRKCGHADCAEHPHLATACLESKAG